MDSHYHHLSLAGVSRATIFACLLPLFGCSWTGAGDKHTLADGAKSPPGIARLEASPSRDSVAANMNEGIALVSGTEPSGVASSPTSTTRSQPAPAGTPSPALSAPGLLPAAGQAARSGEPRLAAVERQPRPATADARAVAKSTRRVTHASEANFSEQVLRSDGPVLVDFYATWCGPCKSLGPTLEQLAAENPHAKVVKVDIDDNPGLAERYGVQSIPHLMVFKDGRIVAKQTGLASKSRLKAMLDL